MSWLFLIVNLVATTMLFGATPKVALFVALAVLALSFTSFCYIYDAPIRRASNRNAQRLGMISGYGLHADEYQRLQSMKIVASDEDKKFQLTFMSGLNIASGIAGGMLLLWACWIRFA
jgi:hypothetical protein